MSSRSHHDQPAPRCAPSQEPQDLLFKGEASILTLVWGRFPGCLLLWSVVIDMRVRPRVTRFLEPIGKALASVGVTPTVITFLGLGVVIAGSVMIATGFPRSGAAVVLGGALLDGLDGSVARASGLVSPRGAFLDSAFDRMGEISAFAGLGFYRAGFPREFLLIVLAIGGAMLVPYMRARAEAEGFDGQGRPDGEGRAGPVLQPSG